MDCARAPADLVMTALSARAADPATHAGRSDRCQPIAGFTEQAQGSGGNLGADVLAEANNTYWTRTAWQERGLMEAFVGGEPHLRTMNRIDDWCDEATFVEWEQAGAELPEWHDGYERLVASGQGPDLTDATPAHRTRDFPPPEIAR